jgi:predicted ATPase
VLDNCEHVIGGCAKTAEAIVRRCPRVRLIVTSREPLGIGGETIYRVPSLSLPGPEGCGSGSAAIESSDAVALFADRARSHGIRLSFDEETGPLVVSVCRRLDGMPLAIELAAARLRSMSLADLHGRLDQRFRLLTGGSRTALARQQTLGAAVGWSYSLLTAAERLLLGRLSVFAGGFGLDAAEAVCGSGDIDVLEVAGLLGSLVDKSLVVAEPGQGGLRYRLLETIRLFAAERLADAGDDEGAAVSAAHCAHFLSVAEAAAPHLTGSEQGSWLAWLDADHANLLRAARHAAADPDGTALVLRFGAALDRYWMDPARGKEAIALLQPVLERPDAAADPALYAAALLAATQLLDTKLRFAEQAVQVSRRIGDDRLLSRSLATLCWITILNSGEPETGLSLGREAVELARRLGDDELMGVSMCSYLSAMDPARSLPLYAEAIACTERSGDYSVNSALHNNAGWVALQTGDLPAARAHLEAAAQANQQTGLEDTALTANLGLLLRAEGDTSGARSTLEAAVRMGRRTGDYRDMASACLGLACLAGDLGEWSRAGLLHGVSQAFLSRAGLPWDKTEEAHYRQDSLDQARAHLGDQQLEQAYTQGLALSLDQALDLAFHGADRVSQGLGTSNRRDESPDDAR